MKKFWTVWSPQSPRSNPTVKHDSYATAKIEALRLARHIPGQEFIVMEGKYYVTSKSVFEVELV